MPVIWITGLPGSGKTRLASALAAELADTDGPCLLLDGDDLRGALAPLADGYSETARRRFAHTYSNLAALADAQGLTCIVATVSLFAAVHALNRSRFGRYLEVLLVCDDAERERRRPAARLAEGDRMGGDIAPEWPRAPHLVFDTTTLPVEAIAYRVVQAWRAHG